MLMQSHAAHIVCAKSRQERGTVSLWLHWDYWAMQRKTQTHSNSGRELNTLSHTHTQTHTLAWGPEIHKNKQFLYFTFKGNIIVTLTYLRCCHICMGSVTWDKTSLLRNTIGNAFGLFFMMLIFCLIFFVFVVIQKYLKIKFQWFSKLKIWYVLI